MSIPKPDIVQTRSLFLSCIAITYGFVLSQLPDVHFFDFYSYLYYAESSWLLALGFANGGLLTILSNDPIWLLLNAGLSIFLDPETVVRTIIFLGATTVAWHILRYYPRQFVWLILFLLLPQVIKNYLVHLRQGFAIAVFLLGWFAVHRSARWLLLGATPFIHASFVFILALLALTWLLRSVHVSSPLKTISYFSMAIAIGLSLGTLAELSGARQFNEYAFMRTDVSGLGFLQWAMVLGVILTAGKTWLREHAFESGVLIFYLGTYWLIEVTARIFESGLITLLLAGLSLPGWRRQAFLGIVLGAGALDWLRRISQPVFGFGSA
jgi:hypothetical protein